MGAGSETTSLRNLRRRGIVTPEKMVSCNITIMVKIEIFRPSSCQNTPSTTAYPTKR